MHRWTGLLIIVVSLAMVASASGGQNETTDTMPSRPLHPIRDRVSPEQRRLRAREMRILEQLGNAATAWLKTADQSSRRQVDMLIDELLGQAKPAVRAYFAAARVADLCGDTDKAIAILQDVAAKHGTENAPGRITEPVNVVAYHWIGRLARHAGDAETALLAYQTAEANSSDLKGKDIHALTCKVYIAEMALADTKDKARAKKRLDELEGKLNTVEQGNIKVPGWGVIRDWAQYRHATMKGDKNKARHLLQGSSDYKRHIQGNLLRRNLRIHRQHHGVKEAFFYRTRSVSMTRPRRILLSIIILAAFGLVFNGVRRHFLAEAISPSEWNSTMNLNRNPFLAEIRTAAARNPDNALYDWKEAWLFMKART